MRRLSHIPFGERGTGARFACIPTAAIFLLLFACASPDGGAEPSHPDLILGVVAYADVPDSQLVTEIMTDAAHFYAAHGSLDIEWILLSEAGGDAADSLVGPGWAQRPCSNDVWEGLISAEVLRDERLTNAEAPVAVAVLGGAIRSEFLLRDRLAIACPDEAWLCGDVSAGAGVLTATIAVDWRTRDAAELAITVAHELGHVVGLGHEKDGSAPECAVAAPADPLNLMTTSEVDGREGLELEFATLVQAQVEEIRRRFDTGLR